MAHSNEVEHSETVSVGDDCFTVDQEVECHERETIR